MTFCLFSDVIYVTFDFKFKKLIIDSGLKQLWAYNTSTGFKLNHKLKRIKTTQFF